MNIIEILWEGPFALEQVLKMDGKSDYGVYQIYGLHSIMGPNTLVYIGKAENRTFSMRFNDADRSEWIGHEFHEFKMFLGRLGGESYISKCEWDQKIDYAERILIDYCQPAFNSKNSNLIDCLPTDLTLINHGKRQLLPYSITTLWKQSSMVKGSWKLYHNKMY